MAEKRLGFVVDLYRCIGCHTCAVTCKIENNLPKHGWWNRITTDGGNYQDTPAGEYPNIKMNYVPIACQHCESPACTKVCPVGATYKRDDGVVFQDSDKCIGCRMCIAACPYTGVRSFNWEEPEFYYDFSLGGVGISEHQKHTVEKCTMCSHRLAREEEPACVNACPAHARYWGDFNDPNSEVSQLILKREYKQLLQDRGTNPSVYYLL